MAHQLQYWPRYIARLLRVRYEYRGPLAGWRLEFPGSNRREPDGTDSPPTWRVSESHPWNLANRCTSYPYPVQWRVEWPDGKKDEFGVRKNDEFRVHPYLPAHWRREPHALPTEHYSPHAREALAVHEQQEREEELYATDQPLEPLVFRGDRVQILVGPDAGKLGNVRIILKAARLCYVEGLNQTYLQPQRGSAIEPRELPLHVDRDVQLVDPADNTGCEAEWRYTESGDRVRVSKRSGIEIPIPPGVDMTDDLIRPSHYKPTVKDTTGEAVRAATYKPALFTFEQEIDRELGVGPSPPRAATHFY